MEKLICVNIDSVNGLLPDTINYDMTVWILVGNDINFSTASGFIRLHELVPCVMKAGVWHHVLHANHCYHFSEIRWPLNVKINNVLVCLIIDLYFIVAELLLPHLKTPILVILGGKSHAPRPTTGIVKRQFLSLRGTMRRNNGNSTWNSSHFSTKFVF